MTYFKDELIINKDLIVQYPYPAKLSNVFSNIGFSQLETLEQNLLNRKSVAKYYNDILDIYPQSYIEDDKNIFLRYSFLVRNREQWREGF